MAPRRLHAASVDGAPLPRVPFVTGHKSFVGGVAPLGWRPSQLLWTFSNDKSLRLWNLSSDAYGMHKMSPDDQRRMFDDGAATGSDSASRINDLLRQLKQAQELQADALRHAFPVSRGPAPTLFSLALVHTRTPHPPQRAALAVASLAPLDRSAADVTSLQQSARCWQGLRGVLRRFPCAVS
jgi:hypothetical protein